MIRGKTNSRLNIKICFLSINKSILNIRLTTNPKIKNRYSPKHLEHRCNGLLLILKHLSGFWWHIQKGNFILMRI